MHLVLPVLIIKYTIRNLWKPIGNHYWKFIFLVGKKITSTLNLFNSYQSLFFSWNISSGKCPSGKCPSRNLSRGNVFGELPVREKSAGEKPPGNCPDTHNNKMLVVGYFEGELYLKPDIQKIIRKGVWVVSAWAGISLSSRKHKYQCLKSVKCF